MKPLEGLIVLDLSRVLAGPFCTMRLADMGAEVIKIESPEGDPTRKFGPPFVGAESPYFMSFNRGKRAISLDLKSTTGLEFTRRVLSRADVLVENFRPGVMSRLGLSDEAIAEAAPRIVHVSITGYGPESSRSHDAAFDLAIQAESGLMAMSGEEGSAPVRAPISIADLSASVAATEAILAAIIRRDRLGLGAKIHISLLESLISLFGYQAQNTIMSDESPERMGHRHPNLMPYQAFATADGNLVLAVGTDAQWRRLTSLKEMPSGLDAEPWRTNAGRVMDRNKLEDVLGKAFASQTTAFWQGRLKSVDVPLGVLRDLKACLASLREEHSTFLRSYQHASLGQIEMTTGPIIMEGEGRLVAPDAPPVENQHADELLLEFAENAAEFERWKASLL